MGIFHELSEKLNTEKTQIMEGMLHQRFLICDSKPVFCERFNLAHSLYDVDNVSINTT